MTVTRGAILALLVLAACAPDPRCGGREQTALVALDREIAALERDIARGYRIEPAQDPQTRLSICAWPREPVLFCTEPIQPARSERRIALDPTSAEAERRSLNLRRAELVAALASAQAQCVRP